MGRNVQIPSINKLSTKTGVERRRELEQNQDNDNKRSGENWHKIMRRKLDEEFSIAQMRKKSKLSEWKEEQ